MTNPEFSTQFDVWYNNITSNQAPGLNEYEKSVFLTKAEKMLVKEYFNERADVSGGGFDGSQKRQYDFSSIIVTKNLIEIPRTLSFPTSYHIQIDKRSRVFLFPEDYFLSVNEILSDSNYQYSVLPIDYAEYQRLMLKPYSLPTKRGAWRLITGKTHLLRKVQVVVEDAISEETSFETYDNFITAGGTVVPYSVKVSIQDTPNGIVELHTITAVSTETINKEDIAVSYTTSANSGIVPVDVVPKDGAIDGQEASSESEDYVSTTVPIVEILGKFTGELHYKIRYIKNLEPIILDDLTNWGEGLEIDGKTQMTECKLPDECHDEILERAVLLARIAWSGSSTAQEASKTKD